jgi:hypothetical protein
LWDVFLTGHGVFHIGFFPFLEIGLRFKPYNFAVRIDLIDDKIGESVLDCTVKLIKLLETFRFHIPQELTDANTFLVKLLVVNH